MTENKDQRDAEIEQLRTEIETFKATYMEHLGIPPSVAHVLVLKADMDKLRAENKRLRDALTAFANAGYDIPPSYVRRASEAMKGEPNEPIQ